MRKIFIALDIIGILVLIVLVSFKLFNISVVKNKNAISLEKDWHLNNYINSTLDGKYMHISELNTNNNYDITYMNIGIKPEVIGDIDDNIDKKLYKDISNISISLNTTGIKDYIDKLNENRTKNIYPHIEEKNEDFTVTTEHSGNYLDADKLYSDICNNIENNINNVELSDYYIAFDTGLKNSKQLQEEIDKYKQFEVNYINGASVSYNDIKPYIKNTDTELMIVSQNELPEYIEALLRDKLKKLKQSQKTYEFLTHNMENIEVESWDYEITADYDKETEYIVDKILKLENEYDRTPIWKKEQLQEIGDTYIEISKEEQHLWYYVNGEILIETDVVTGKPSRKGGTPSGLFQIIEKKKNKTLKGDTWSSFVNRWMRITWDGIGLHDATWRGRFGGQIYVSDGSHGCVNLPLSFAKQLYEATYYDTVVVIY